MKHPIFKESHGLNIQYITVNNKIIFNERSLITEQYISHKNNLKQLHYQVARISTLNVFTLPFQLFLFTFRWVHSGCSLSEYCALNYMYLQFFLSIDFHTHINMHST